MKSRFDSTSHMLRVLSSCDSRLPKGPWDAVTHTPSEPDRTPIGILSGCTLQDDDGHDCLDPNGGCVRVEFARYHLNDFSKPPQHADNVKQVDESIALCLLRNHLPEFIRTFAEMHSALDYIAPTSATGTWLNGHELAKAAVDNFNAASGMADEYAAASAPRSPTMSDLPLDEAALDRAKKRIEHGDWPADNTLHALVAQSRAALTLRARVAELEAKCADLREDNAYFRKQSWEHCSHAAKLREALVKADAMIRKLLAGAVTDTGADETGAAIGAALASTPAADLSAHAAEVLTLAFNELSRLGAFVPGGMDMARALAAHEVKP